MGVDEEFLSEIGVRAMSKEEKQAFIEFAQEELEVRVGEEISSGLSEEEIQEFENAGSDDEARAWLQEHKPDYKEIVKRVTEGLKEEIKRNKARI